MNILKLKAGALQLTMFIVVVIALLLASFVLLINTHKTFKMQTDFVLETIENANKGIRYVLQNDIQQEDTLVVDLEDEPYKSLKVYCDDWGIFKKVISIASIKNKTFKKVAILGAIQPQEERMALYVQDNNRPLVLVGSTRIQGAAFIPKQGVRTGNISGHSYYGESLIYGRTNLSGDLPKLQLEIHNPIKNSIANVQNMGQNQFLDLSVIKTFQNSFLDPLKRVFSNAAIDLSGVSLIGNILIQSETKIIVEASSNLKDVILIAPKIEVKDKTKGTFQAFATEDIVVGAQCQLNYPSALVVNETGKRVKPIGMEKESPFIKVIKGSVIKGVIAYLGTSKNYKPQVFIDVGASIVGEVYCNQNVELLGTIYGRVLTSNFVASQSGSVYQNHIYNGKIIIDELPKEYVGLTFEDSKKGIAKWLY